MEKFLGVFLDKTITGQKNPVNGKEKTVNGFSYQRLNRKNLKNTFKHVKNKKSRTI